MGFIRRELKSYINVTSWMGVNNLRTVANQIISLARSLFVQPAPARSETFEAACKRLQLSEADLAQRKKSFVIFVKLFSTMAILLYLYLLYLIWERYVLGAMTNFGLLCVVLAYLFRYHFWLYQLEQRRLGCTLQEWITHTLLGRKT